jgi:hypothetical protein
MTRTQRSAKPTSAAAEKHDGFTAEEQEAMNIWRPPGPTTEPGGGNGSPVHGDVLALRELQ